MGLPRALKAHQEGELDLAEKHYKRALTQDDSNPVIYQNYGSLLRTLQRLDEAESLYFKGLSLHPEHLGINSNSLLFRNLMRSSQLKIASGQNIAKRMGLMPLDRLTLLKYDRDCLLEKNNMLDHTPLLIYILKESEIFADGQYLTGVGGILVAETILSLLIEDPNSYFNSNEKWYPSLPSRLDSQFFMGDLIKFVYS